MKSISESTVRRDHLEKASGEALYVADYPQSYSLCGKMLRSKVARGRIINVTIPTLPDGYFYVDKNDVPGDNNVNIVKDDTPVFARETVEYIGEPIGMFCGPDEVVVDQLLADTVVEIEELPPVFGMDTATEAFFEYSYEKGNVDEAFAEADQVIEEEFFTGHQEQAYLETQGMMAEIDEDHKIHLHGSMQCPYYIKGAVMRVMGFDADHIRVSQDATGGGFGGKEEFPSILGAQVAVAAYKAKQAVRCVFDRREDMEFTSKRHPSHMQYKVAVKDGKVTAMEVEVLYDAGAYSTLSAVVLQRGIICCNGVYYVPNMRVHGRAVKTNTTPTGAFRGFGAPQVFFSVDMMMTHVAQKIGMKPVDFKLLNVAKQGDSTSTEGRFHEPVPMPAMIEQIDNMCDFRHKYDLYSKPQTGRYRRGIGMSLAFHGCGFTGSGERDLIKARMKLHKLPDGTVVAHCINTDMGQGLRTTFPKIMAHELGIPMEKVVYDYPDTDVSPDSGPTVASRSMMIVGELLRQACVEMKEIWVDGEDQWVEKKYVQPDFMIPFSIENFKGDAYPTYSWSVNVCEVEVDTCTGLVELLGGYGVYDVGTPIDYNIVIGQMEGGFVQALGNASIEIMNYDQSGRIRNNSFTDYIIPTAMDVPNLQVALHVEDYAFGPYGAKGAGELPTVGGQASYVEAVEQALSNGKRINHIPMTAEDTISLLKKGE